MTDDSPGEDATADDSPRSARPDGLVAHRCSNGHLTYPGHGRCPECGTPQNEQVDLSDREAEVVTWTESTATPPGVREPNELAIVAFSVEGETVRAIGQVDGTVDIGTAVEPVYVDQLRDPAEGFRARASQAWSGYRFRPVE